MGYERAVDVGIDGEYITLYFNQGDMTEDEFFEVVCDYVYSNLQIEIT